MSFPFFLLIAVLWLVVRIGLTNHEDLQAALGFAILWAAVFFGALVIPKDVLPTAYSITIASAGTILIPFLAAWYFQRKGKISKRVENGIYAGIIGTLLVLSGIMIAPVAWAVISQWVATEECPRLGYFDVNGTVRVTNSAAAYSGAQATSVTFTPYGHPASQPEQNYTAQLPANGAYLFHIRCQDAGSFHVSVTWSPVYPNQIFCGVMDKSLTEATQYNVSC